MNDLGDDDFDFDLDEIVKFESQPGSVGTHLSSLSYDANSSQQKNISKNEGLSGNKPIETSKIVCEDEWGSDDDSTFLDIKEPDFQSTPFPTTFVNNKACTDSHSKVFESSILQPRMRGSKEGFNPIQSQCSFYGEPDFHSTPLPPPVATSHQPNSHINRPTGRPPNTQMSQNQNQNFSILDVLNKKNQPQTRTITEKPKARFPGPAGVLVPIIEDKNKLKEHRHKVTKQLMSIEGLVGWDQALAQLNLTSFWENKKVNLHLIKRTFVPGSFRMRVPLLIVGVQKIDYPPVIQEDVRCILQDPTGEVKGCIVKDVITTYGTQINSGSILILRRPSILQDFPTYHVLVTVSCLFGIYSKTGELKHCKTFNNSDLATWLSESMDYGDVADVYIEKPKSPVKLFTTISDVAGYHQSAPTGSRQFQSPAPNRPVQSRPFTPRTGANHTRPPSFPAPRSSAITPNLNYARPRADLNSAPPSRPCVRAANNSVQPRPPPSSASSSFQFKAPSAVVSAPRPAPYNPRPNRAQSVATPSPSSSTQQQRSPTLVSQEPPAANDEFLSQFLSGVDTDALFDDF